MLNNQFIIISIWLTPPSVSAANMRPHH